MTVANTNVETTYNGDGSTVNFPVTFALFEKDVVKVYLIDELTADTTTPSGFAETLQVETTDFTFDADPPTQVQMNTAPTTDEKLRVERQSPITQNTDLISGQDNADVNEIQLDRITHILQENANKISRNEAKITAPGAATASSGSFPDWQTGINYLQYQVVIRNGRQYRVTVDHLSNTFSTDLLDGKLEELTYKGIKGDKGDKGDDGADGADSAVPGPTGPAGADGADGVFSAIATQGEAQTGTDNVKGMTPLRTAEAIAAQVPVAQITTNQNNITSLTSSLAALTSRVTALESQVQQATGKFAGQQQLLNNQAVAVALEGLAAGGDNSKGNPLKRTNTGAEFAKVMVAIKRVTSTDVRFATFDLIMQFVDGGWVIGRDATDQLDATLDLDGVTLSVVNTDVGGGIIEGQVYYVSDNMSGTDHDDESVISWLGQEISIL